MNESIIKGAVGELGQKEIVGPEHNPTIVNYAKSIGASWVNDDETPWCAIFVNWVLMQNKFKYSSSARARDFEKYGLETTDPVPGDIAVFWRGTIDGDKGHVAFFLGYNFEKTHVFVIGGNQSNGVTIAKYSVTNILSFRRVIQISPEKTEIPEPPLKKGDKNPRVGQLQGLLKALGLYKGGIDNDFGSNTEFALSDFKVKYKVPTSRFLYDEETKQKLFELTNQ